MSAVLDICAEYRQLVCVPLFRILGAAKELRSRADGIGLTQFSQLGGGPGPALGGVVFPLSGELTHIVSGNQLLALIAGLEALEAAMGTPAAFRRADGTNGTTYPVAAFAQFRG